MNWGCKNCLNVGQDIDDLGLKERSNTETPVFIALTNPFLPIC